MNSNKSVLLVDDGENDLVLLRIALGRAGFRGPIREARGGQEAMAYLGGSGVYADRKKYLLPTFMLLDLNMPKVSGFELLAWVRAQEDAILKNLPIVILSASMRALDMDRALELGANSFLVKPGTLDGLVEMMRGLDEWLGSRRFPSVGEILRYPGA